MRAPLLLSARERSPSVPWPPSPSLEVGLAGCTLRIHFSGGAVAAGASVLTRLSIQPSACSTPGPLQELITPDLAPVPVAPTLCNLGYGGRSAFQQPPILACGPA